MAAKCLNCGREREAHGEDGRCPKGFSGTWKAYDDSAVRDMQDQRPCLRCGKPESEHGGLLSHRYVPQTDMPATAEEPPAPASDPDLCAKCGQAIDAHTEGGYCKAKGLPKGSKFTPGGSPLGLGPEVQTSAQSSNPQILITYSPELQAVNVEYRNFKNVEFILSTIEQARIVMEQHRQSLAAQATMAALSAQPARPGAFDMEALRKGRPS